MLPPVSAVSTASASLAQRDVPAVAQQVLATLAATPDAAVALSLAANSEVEGKLNMLILSARERMIDSLFAVVDAVSQSLAMQPEAGESNVGYALRLAAVVNDLPPSKVASVQQQLNAQGQTAPLALVARALQNPAGAEAAQVVAYLEVVRYKEKDLATKAVVASYGQNGGAEEPETETSPTLTPVLPAPAGSSPQNAAPGQSKSPATGGSNVPTASLLSPVSEEPAEAANAHGSVVSTPLPLTGAASPQAAQAPARAPSTTTPNAPQAAAPVPMPEGSAMEAIATPQSATAPLAAETPRQAVPASTTVLPTQRDEQAATSARLPTSTDANLQDVSRSATNPPASTPATLSPRTSQAPAGNAAASPLTSAPATPQLQPSGQAAAGYQPAPVTMQAFMEAAELAPVVAVMEEEIQSVLQSLPQAAESEQAPAAPSPSLQQPQPQTAPAGDPLRSVVSGQVPQDVQAVLKVVVDRLVSATGVELLQTMAEVEPVAEKIVAQALVADMLDSAELGTLPSPDDAALATHAAQIQQSAALATESPAEELASLIALNRMLAEGIPVAQALVQPQPQQFPLLPGVPFAIGQYLPAEDVAEESEPLHIDRVDAVEDEEQESSGSRQKREADEEAADEQPEADQAFLAADEALQTDAAVPEASEPVASRPLALPRPAPMEPVVATAFNLYQRMGNWD